MNELKVNIGEKVTLKKLSTMCTPERIEDVVLEYVGRRTAKAIINAVTDIVGDENVVVAKVNGTLYKLVLNNGVPSFVVYNIKKDIEIALMEKGFTTTDAAECVEALFVSRPDWIPAGFKYHTGDLETGYVVKDKKGNEFTYCPAIDQYISRYEISKGDDGDPMSVPGKNAWVDIDYAEAKGLAKFFVANGKSGLISDSDWSKMCEFLATKIDRILIFKDSTSIGAYRNNGREVRTGENSNFMIYNIDCLAGNHWCITDDFNEYGSLLIRGGSYAENGDCVPMVDTDDICAMDRYYNVGFRIVLKK